MDMRRLIAKVSNVKEIVTGKFIKRPGFQSSYVLTEHGRKLSRIRTLGVVVDKFSSQDGNYGSITLDDGTGTVRCKAFVNTKIFDGIVAGDLIDVFGKIREYQQEIYVIPEIIRKADPNLETLRILELKKLQKEQKEKFEKLKQLQARTSNLTELKNAAKNFLTPEEVEAMVEAQEIFKEENTRTDAKTKVLQLIISLDEGTGVEYKDILDKSGFSEHDIDLAIQDLLESGICFEPAPGKIKKL